MVSIYAPMKKSNGQNTLSTCMHTNLPHDRRWHGSLHVIIADVGHLSCEQVVDLNATITLGRGYVFIVIVEAHAKCRNINGA